MNSPTASVILGKGGSCLLFRQQREPSFVCTSDEGLSEGREYIEIHLRILSKQSTFRITEFSMPQAFPAMISTGTDVGKC